MSGFPPIQIFLLCIAFAILAIPLAQLTGKPAHPARTSAQSATKGAVSSLVRLRYAHKPTSVSLQQNGVELLAGIDLTASPAKTRAILSTPNKNGEMVLTASWPAGTPDTALTIEIEPDGLDTRSETRWSSAGQLSEVLTFRW